MEAECPTSLVPQPPTAGTFRLRPHDVAGATGLRGTKIDADAGKFYWLDMRRQFEWNLTMSMGIEVRRVTKRPPDSYR